jgi:hypothetical protein
MCDTCSDTYEMRVCLKEGVELYENGGLMGEGLLQLL